VSSGKALCALAAALHRAGKLPEALEAFTSACSASPTNPVAWNGRAAILTEMGCDGEAASALAEAIIATDGDISVLANMAILKERQGCLEDAAETAARVIDTMPDHSTARYTAGLALLRLGRPNEAISHYLHLTMLCPERPDVFLNLGEALMATDKYGEALAAYERAIQLNPSWVTAIIGKGQALAMLERFEEADALFEELIRTHTGEAHMCFQHMARSVGQRIPDGWIPRAAEIYLSRCWSQQQVCDWRFRQKYLDKLDAYAEWLSRADVTAHDPSLAFQCLAASLPANNRKMLLDRVAAGIASSAGPQIRRRRLRKLGPLRLGFLSADFRESPTAQLHWRQLALHDRSRFEVHAYSLFDEKNSPLRARVVESVDKFHNLSQATATEAAWRISRDGIDILIDLTGILDNARPEILALKPAPISVSYMGGLVPLGKRLVDYRISDRITTPVQDEFTEALALLPHTHFIYNDMEAIADHAPTRQECGLPPDGTVFCAFNSAFKIEPGIFSIWMRLLRECPDSVLWLREAGDATTRNLRGAAIAQGIAGDRLVFAPRMERAVHLARHAHADLFLDTFVCNAGTTAADALWAGLPVLTCAGNTMASRLATSLVTAAGIPELAVSSAEEYLALAIKLAGSPHLLQGLRRRLAGCRATSRLFATQLRVKHLSQAFEMMWERHVQGTPPMSFEIIDDEDVRD
jgi:predicted O-linked N-acetylglucosamine transferase (SPINDLY family)